ncbi:hypothetical protein [Absidia glauca]|uniref:Uncharacterized protein n=1 Tax=Absidia glauca TaxID=4829 RepID=A0A168QIF2_ABSGL|nr:hypothetical protein [Absidia glauca]
MVVRTDWVKEWGTLEVQWQRNLQWKTFMGDKKQCWSRHYFCRRRYRRRHRRSESKVEAKIKDVKTIVSHGGKR